MVIFNHYELYFQTLKKKQKRLNYSNEKEKLQSEYNLGWDVSDLILMTCFAIYGQKNTLWFLIECEWFVKSDMLDHTSIKNSGWNDMGES